MTKKLTCSICGYVGIQPEAKVKVYSKTWRATMLLKCPDCHAVMRCTYRGTHNGGDALKLAGKIAGILKGENEEGGKK